MGHLIYLTNTRPDLIFAISIVNQFMYSPRTSHLDVVYHILRYLKTCPGLGLFYKSGIQSSLSCFTNADYAGSKSDRRSTSVLFMVFISFFEKVRSKLLSLGLLLKPSTVPWLRAQVSFFGFDLFWLS